MSGHTKAKRFSEVLERKQASLLICGKGLKSVANFRRTEQDLLRIQERQILEKDEVDPVTVIFTGPNL
jgi:hypothetical protein